MITSSTAPASTRARETASRMVTAPSCGAVNEERPPRYRPIGVRTAETMTGVVLSDTETAPVGVTDGKITLAVGVAPVEREPVIPSGAQGFTPQDRISTDATWP